MSSLHWECGKDEKGQTLIEFALTLMITLFVIIGVMECGRAVYTASVVQWAAQEGARAGIIDLADVVPAVESRLVALDPDLATIAVTQPNGNTVNVNVTYHFEFITPIISQFAADGIDLTSSASMVSF